MFKTKKNVTENASRVAGREVVATLRPSSNGQKRTRGAQEPESHCKQARIEYRYADGV
jgi:hypothetical protein